MNQELANLQNYVNSNFLEPYKNDTPIPESERNAGTTTDLSEYLHTVEMMADHRELSSMLKLQQITFDYEVVKNASVYALGPVCMYDAKCRAMESKRFSTMKELRDSLQGRKYGLYHTAICVKTYDYDENFTPKYLDNPKFSFLFRGFFLD